MVAGGLNYGGPSAQKKKEKENATLSFLAGVAIKVNSIGGSGTANSPRFKNFKCSKV